MLTSLYRWFRRQGAVELVVWMSTRYLRRHWLTMALASACMVVSGITLSAFAWLVEPALRQLMTDRDSAMVYVVPLGIVAILGINGIALYLQSVLTATVGQKVIVEMQSDLFRHFISADMATLNRTHSGIMVSMSVADTGLVLTAVTGLLVGLARDVVLFLFLTGVMLARDWQLTLATLIVLPVLGIGLRAISGQVRRATDAMLDASARMTTLLSEGLNGARLIKTHGTEEYEIQRHRRTAVTRSRLFMRIIRRKSLVTPLSEISTGLAIAAVILYALLQAKEGPEAFASIASFLAALAIAYRPVKRFAASMADLTLGIVAADRIKIAMANRPLVVDPPGAVPLVVGGGTVELEDVSFGYDPARPVLSDISLTIPAGRTAALVGPSGAGKSTLINLLPRLYDVGAGTIRIDGQDISGVTLASLRRSISVVSQEIVLFDDTVRNNIAYSRPEATEEEVVAAAKASAADEFIRSLPSGYNTLIGERGIRLSGGQRQRIAIARAMLKNAPILLLDEATSSLDSESEQVVKLAVKRLMAGRTTLIVAHRLTTVIDADQIHVMVHGRIVESGRHSELIARGGVYARLYSIQSFEDTLANLSGDANVVPIPTTA